MKYKILLAEDDENLGFVTKDNLEMSGFDVDLAVDGMEAEKIFNSKDFDIVLLDVMMPFKDGFSVGKSIREKNEDIPIVFLTAKSLLDDKKIGFDLGADDYIVKPFKMEELVMRINAILKRSQKNTSSRKEIELKDIYFHPEDRILKIKNNNHNLSSKEAELLFYFIKHQGNVLKREDVLEAVWGTNDYFLGRSMDVYITKLRKYLSESEHIKINTVHGIGFKLIVS